MILPPKKKNKYVWQDEALLQWISHTKKDFLAECCVGAGKTTFGINCAKKELSSGNCNFVIILTVNADVAEDFREGGLKKGINLTTDWSPTKKWSDEKLKQYHGIVITYQMLATNPEAVAALVAKFKVLAIFDEIHHLGEDNEWGRRAVNAFERAVKRLGLSGTTFRSDKSKIPFVNFDADGYSIADFRMPYNRGISEGINRNVAFFHTDGKSTWEYKGKIIAKTFKEEVDSNELSARLLTALKTPGFMTKMLEDALWHYDIKRKSFPLASMIIFAIDCNHATWIAEMLSKMGRKVLLLTSKEDGSYERLREFKKNPGGIVVSIDMISEGVNCPPFIVGVHATNVTALGSWWQELGRCLRLMDGYENAEAIWLQPQDPRLEAHANGCMDLQKIAAKIDDDVGGDGGNGDGGDGDDPPARQSSITPISSEGYDGRTILPSQDVTYQLSAEKSADLKSILEQMVDPPTMKQLFELDRIVGGLPRAKPTDSNTPDPKKVEKELREELGILAGILARAMSNKGDAWILEKEKWYAAAWTEVKKATGLPAPEQCSNKQLRTLIRKFKESIEFYGNIGAKK